MSASQKGAETQPNRVALVLDAGEVVAIVADHPERLPETVHIVDSQADIGEDGLPIQGRTSIKPRKGSEEELACLGGTRLSVA